MLPGGFRFARKVLAQLSYNYPGLLHRCAHAWVAPPSTGLALLPAHLLHPLRCVRQVRDGHGAL
jgi:hypothetical protein